jgi:hypothetical protein
MRVRARWRLERGLGMLLLRLLDYLGGFLLFKVGIDLGLIN